MWGRDREILSVDKVIVVAAFGRRILLGSAHCLVVAGCSSPVPTLQLARQHDAQTAAYLPLGHSLGRRALAHACVEVMNWRSALRPNPFPLLTESVRSDAHQDRM